MPGDGATGKKVKKKRKKVQVRQTPAARRSSCATARRRLRHLPPSSPRLLVCLGFACSARPDRGESAALWLSDHPPRSQGHGLEGRRARRIVGLRVERQQSSAPRDEQYVQPSAHAAASAAGQPPAEQQAPVPQGHAGEQHDEPPRRAARCIPCGAPRARANQISLLAPLHSASAARASSVLTSRAHAWNRLRSRVLVASGPSRACVLVVAVVVADCSAVAV